MATSATIYKAALQISDVDRRYFQDHALTLARHPSETDERMMIRLLAFALHAHHDLAFGRGIGTEDEPALWHKDVTGAINLWIEVGQSDEKSLRQAGGRAAQVFVYSYGGRGAGLWWDKNRTALERVRNLAVINIPQDESRALTQFARPSMQLECTIQEGQVWIGNGTATAHIELTILKAAFAPSKP